MKRLSGNWSSALRRFRLRHGLSQRALAGLLGTTPRRVADLESQPVALPRAVEDRLRDLAADVPPALMNRLSASIGRTTLPRALSKGSGLQLQALSKPAILKRPSIVDWIGRDLAPIACGVLREMLDDRALQRAILRREVASIVTTTCGVLRTPESDQMAAFRTTISYFFHDGTIYSDAVAVPVAPGEPIGWTPILADEIGADLFGDNHAIEAGLAVYRRRGPATPREG